ncbi:hypothetical protein ACOMHN_054785 [Nucella lapillus]
MTLTAVCLSNPPVCQKQANTNPENDLSACTSVMATGDTIITEMAYAEVCTIAEPRVSPADSNKPKTSG